MSYTISPMVLIKPLSLIKSASDLATLIGTSSKEMGDIRRNKKKLYHTYFIKKKSGKKREINEPLGQLRRIQESLNTKILSKITPHQSAHAYRRKRSIFTNVKPHLRKKYILTLDFKDFYPSVHESRVITSLVNQGCSDAVAMAIAQLCCYNRRLPQGAPTSPLLANSVLIEFDQRLEKVCRSRRLSYTRYADDIAISGNHNFGGNVIRKVKEIVKEFGLSIADEKTNYMKPSDRKVITGLELTIDGPKPTQEFYDRLAQELNEFDGSIPYIGTATDFISTRRRLEGMINFARMADKDKAQQYKRLLQKVIARFREQRVSTPQS